MKTYTFLIVIAVLIFQSCSVFKQKTYLPVQLAFYTGGIESGISVTLDSVSVNGNMQYDGNVLLVENKKYSLVFYGKYFELNSTIPVPYTDTVNCIGGQQLIVVEVIGKQNK